MNSPANEEHDRWAILPATEKENYLLFHKDAYVEDLLHAEKNVILFPRWSIISGYYGMHNVTKLFLAKQYNIKIASPDIHAKTIRAMEQLIKDKAIKERIIFLLKEAKDVYYSTERLKENVIPLLLKRGKQERGKAQYYTQDYTQAVVVNSQKATYFLQTIVMPYVIILKQLVEEYAS